MVFLLYLIEPTFLLQFTYFMRLHAQLTTLNLLQNLRGKTAGTAGSRLPYMGENPKSTGKMAKSIAYYCCFCSAALGWSPLE